MDAQTAISKVNEILEKEFEVPAAEMRPEATLREDLGLDSLDAVDLVVALERSFGIEVPEEQAKSLATVADLHAFARTLAARNG